MNTEFKIHTETYKVVDSKGIPHIYSNVCSVKIEDKRLILRGQVNVIATFSNWESSTVAPSEEPLFLEG